MAAMVELERAGEPGAWRATGRKDEGSRGALAGRALTGPYRVVLERLGRLVQYRAQMQRALAADAGNQHAMAELVRIGQMIREVHRAVSLNAEARQLAQRLDLGEPG